MARANIKGLPKRQHKLERDAKNIIDTYIDGKNCVEVWKNCDGKLMVLLKTDAILLSEDINRVIEKLEEFFNRKSRGWLLMLREGKIEISFHF